MTKIIPLTPMKQAPQNIDTLLYPHTLSTALQKIGLKVKNGERINKEEALKFLETYKRKLSKELLKRNLKKKYQKNQQFTCFLILKSLLCKAIKGVLIFSFDILLETHYY